MKFKNSEKRILKYIGSLTYITGTALFIFSRWVRVDTPVGEQHHPSEFWIRLAHSILTYTVVLAAGYLLKAHVWPGFQSPTKRRLKSGATLVSIFVVLLSSAVILLYAGDGSFREVAAWSHAVVGLSVPLIIVMHLYGYRKRAIRKLAAR